MENVPNAIVMCILAIYTRYRCLGQNNLPAVDRVLITFWFCNKKIVKLPTKRYRKLLSVQMHLTTFANRLIKVCATVYANESILFCLIRDDFLLRGIYRHDLSWLFVVVVTADAVVVGVITAYLLIFAKMVNFDIQLFSSTLIYMFVSSYKQMGIERVIIIPNSFIDVSIVRRKLILCPIILFRLIFFIGSLLFFRKSKNFKN